MKAIAFLCLFLAACSPKGPENNVQLVEREQGLQCIEKEEGLIFFSYKHVDVSEASRMMAAILYLLPDEPLVELCFEEVDGYVSSVVYEQDRLTFYIWQEKKGRRIKVKEEPFEGIMERSFGQLTRDQVPFSK
ncbi:MAG: hypothetical protein KDK62_06085 [Chlamydiia bacterium]|nr:hypothetical protein [Chlamydiia bacterium]